MISGELLKRFFEAASIQRWNDHISPVLLTELDKQAHKMVIAYVIAKFEEERREMDWIRLIEGGMFEFLHRVVLTDIKPPVFHRMMREKRDKLNEYVLGELEDEIRGLDEGFQQNFRKYIADSEYSAFEKSILRAAHYLATDWEFRIIYNTSPFIYGIEQTKRDIEDRIQDHYDLVGVQKFSRGKKSYGFIDICGQLRFQKRWANTPRIPETSVLGHMLIVAMISYLSSLEIEACDKRLYNNFYGGLFHDLPEVLTRDIVSPVKTSVEGLDGIIKEYEQNQMEEELLPLLPLSWHEEMNYFTVNEFENKIREHGVIRKVSIKEINNKYNYNKFSPIDGELIEVCDTLAAYIEASLSIEHGIMSKHLTEGKKEIYTQYKDKKVDKIDFGEIFGYFF